MTRDVNIDSIEGEDIEFISNKALRIYSDTLFEIRNELKKMNTYLALIVDEEVKEHDTLEE